MVSVNRPPNMPNGQMSNISNKVQNQRLAVACGTAIAFVAIVLSLLYAGLRISDVGNGTGPKAVVDCHRKDLEGKCEIDKPFYYIGGAGFPSTSCSTVKSSCDMNHQTLIGFPSPGQSLKDCIIQKLGYSPNFEYTYPVPISGQSVISTGVTHVLVNSCHGCLCLKLQVRYIIGCRDTSGKRRRHAVMLPRSAPPACEVLKGEPVNVVVSKTGTDESSVDIQIVGQKATAGVDYQVIAPFTLNFDQLGDQVMGFSIQTFNDEEEEEEEDEEEKTFEVQLSNPSSGIIEYPILTITIIDNGRVVPDTGVVPDTTIIDNDRVVPDTGVVPDTVG